MNRFVKTGSLLVLCSAASVALAAPDETAYKSSSEYTDAINGYMNWQQTENTTVGFLSKFRNSGVFLTRANNPPSDDDLDVAMADYMSRGMEESEFAAAEPASGTSDNPAFSSRAAPSSKTDNFSDAMLNYLDELKQ